MVLISWLRLACAQTRPYLLIGWLWFLGTLVPVIGLVKVGGAALADRYTYFPPIGIFIVVAFGARDLAAQFQRSEKILAGSCRFDSRRLRALDGKPTGFWRDSETLFRRALAVTQDNAIAHIDLGAALEQHGHCDEALGRIPRSRAARARPLSNATTTSPTCSTKSERPAEALAEYREAIRLNPGMPILHNGLGLALAELGQLRRGRKRIRRGRAA